ncbi:hypothetical protein DK66_3150 [Brucella suis 1330]|nr:hypothetical protein DK66_3150 [Brucella suis 1330]
MPQFSQFCAVSNIFLIRLYGTADQACRWFCHFIRHCYTAVAGRGNHLSLQSVKRNLLKSFGRFSRSIL